MRSAFAVLALCLLLAGLAVAQPTPPTITSTSPLPNADASSPYSFTFTATGGSGSYTWSAPSGTPAGLTLSAAGVLSGTPTTPSSPTSPYSIIVQVTDTVSGAAGFGFFALTVNQALAITTTSPLTQGEVGLFYSTTFGVGGGQAPYTWSATGVPGGLTLNAATGTLSGTPAASGTFNVNVSVQDGTTSPPAVVSKPFSLTIAPALTITNVSPMTTGEVNVSYSYTFNATGGVTPYSWSLASGSNPAPGLTLNQQSGVVSGFPTTAGTYTYIPQAADNLGRVVTGPALTLTILTGPSITSTSPLPNGDAGSPYSFTFAATGGQGPYTWSAPSGTPAGLTLSSAGVLSGTPTQAGAGQFLIVQVRDSLGGTNSTSFTVTINPALAITTTSPLPQGEVGLAYSGLTFAASGGQSPYTWSATGLPGGLTLNASTGALGGTPTASGTFTVNVSLQDGTTSPPATVSKPFSLTIAPALTVTNVSPMTTGEVNVSYTYTFNATGGVTPYSWSLASGSNPAPGLTLNPQTGVLTGTPTTAGTYTYIPQVADNLDRFVTGPALTLTILSAPSITSTSPLPNGDAGSPYSFTFAATGGQTPYTWSAPSGTPAGLTLNPTTGVLSGTPTTAGTSQPVIVQVRDALGGTGTTTFAVTINPALVITSNPPLPQGMVSAAYAGFTFASTGGQAPYTWSVASGSTLGLTLSAVGVLSGTPTIAGASTLTVQVKDGLGVVVQKAFPLNIANALNITNTGSMPTGDANVPYSYTFNATGGYPPYTWSLGSSSGAPGLSLNPQTGVLSGIPGVAGSFSYAPQVTDSLGNSFTLPRVLSLTIVSGPSITSTSPLPPGIQGVAYSFNFAATGGTPPYTWSFFSGTLPSGLSVDGSGSLHGTPTNTGSFTFTVQVRDAGGGTGSGSFSLTINPSLTITTTSPLASGAVGTPYRVQFAGNGGQPPYTWSLGAGSTLPSGLGFGSNGVLSGTPSAAGAANFSVQLADAAGTTISKSFSITITSQLVITSTSPLPSGIVGVAYSFSFGTSGATPPVKWSVASGALPGGLSLDAASGQLSGTPTAAGSFSFGVSATDASPQTASATFSITIVPKLTITSTSPLAGGTVNTPYSAQLGATGGNPPYTWSIQSGALPGGLSLGAAGVISGTPTTAGSFSATIQVADKTTPTAQTASQAFSITVTAAKITITTGPTLPAGTAGSSYSVTLAATGGTPPYTWAASGLPGGLALDPATGTISGTPSAGGNFQFGVTVSDTQKNSASQQFSLLVNVPAGPGLTFTNLPNPATPNQQPQFQFSAPQPYPLDITGQLQLTFNSGVGVDDPMIRFVNGTRLLNFTIPAGSTTPIFAPGDQPVFLTGTTAGTIILSVSLYRAGGQDIQPVPPPTQIQIPAGSPVITQVTATRTSTGFTVRVVGFSTQRQVLRGRFQFGGTSLQTTQLDLTLDTLFASWYQTPQSAQLGTQFALTQPFNTQGDPQTVTSVTVILSSPAGDSAPVTAQLQ